MNLGFGNMHTTIRLTVVTVFLVATALTAALAISLQYYFGQIMARDAAAEMYTTASDGIAAELRGLTAINANVIDLLADNPSLPDATQQDAHLQSFIRVLQKNPIFYGVYFGRSDGSFFEVINLDASEKARLSLRALPSDRWVVVTVEQRENGGLRHFRYLKENLDTRFTRSESTDFDVRSRGWYTEAMASEGIKNSGPYLFAQLGVPGSTLSRRIQGTDTVVAIDITLASMSELLAANQIAERGDIYLYNKRGEIIAYSLDYHFAAPQLPVPDFVLTPAEKKFIASLPELKVSNELDWPPFDYAQSGAPWGYSVDVMHLIARMTGIKIQFINGYTWTELVEQFKTGELDLLHSVAQAEQNSEWGLFGAAYAEIPFALVTAEGVPTISSVAELADKRLAIPSGWSIAPVVRERFPDVTIIEATNTRDAIEMALAGTVDAALDNEVILKYIARHYFIAGLQYHPNIDLGAGAVPDKLHVLVAPGQEQLREILDRAIAAIGPAQREYLSKSWLEFESEQQAISSSTVPSATLIEMANDPDLFGQLTEAEIADEDYLIYSAPANSLGNARLFVGITTPVAVVMAPFLEKVKLSIMVTAGLMLLLMPLSWLFANPIVRPIKQLAAENDKVRRRDFDEVESVHSQVKELEELSESMVVMVKAIQAHELAQRELMDSFIRLIAQAIDDKSAYTGGHCERVPELALMLAEHASQSDLPSFAEFALDSEDQWREYRIAAWLHDCGKITTPEHIVDKGSKLETIYNRIHEVRMRFEVLWRDAEIEYYEALSTSPADKDKLKETLREKQSQLQDDFAFIAKCNVGGEFLDDAAQARLQQLAKTTWTRYFDDRIGLSPVEELNIPPTEATLPARENLLSDKPEHIIERTRSTDYDPRLGINMDIPEHLYNQGEVYNLSISRGTLTDEDRFKINEHMISTIKMLESLPFPPELKNVPRYASTHHETMRGSGYPRKLPGEQLSIPERILAVADVFEALTASDRPYKKAKPVSVAVDILHKMVLDNHIDKDCFELFIRDKVYLQYAEKFLPPEQIDEVDTAKYL